MRRPFIAGNWKMHKTISETIDFINQLNNLDLPADKDILICPPFTALNKAQKLVNGTKIKLGAQNMHFEENGAFTGEISPLMLKDIGCEYVIIGHSERRHIFGEDNALINNKVKSALEHNIKPVLCIGEKTEQRKAGKTKDVVKNQLLECLEDIHNITKITIAYEPVWAIGTGVNATPEQAEEVHAYIRSLIAERYNKEAASALRILYGGSVKPENVKAIMAQENVDGVLVGGASLHAEKFFKLINFDK